MNINRDNLLDDLCQFAMAGSGLVIGKPGVGKSTVITALKKRLNNTNILSFIIKIDNAFDSSDEAIQAELGLSASWIEKFQSIKLNDGKKAVLIFDAFDAARDEEKRKGFLRQINKALKLLSEKWNIIVCARSYDAQKSHDLQRLFPMFQEQTNYKRTRSFEVPELSESEIHQLQESSPELWEFYSGSSLELRSVLKVPFFLSLLEYIISSSAASKIEIIKSFRSEVQLLDEYWQIKIVSADQNISKELLLSRLTTELVNRKILNISIQDFPIQNNNDFIYLRSENIIDEVGLNGLSIAFSHNIIFDYAVSRYSLSEHFENLSEFISSDKSRPFFFRPSFIYFFTSLWHNKRNAFWKLYFLFSSDGKKEIQLFIRLIISTVLASEISAVKDIEPILTSEPSLKAEQLRNLLQSLRFISNQSNPSEISLLVELSKNLDIIYLFEFGYLLDRSLSDSSHLEKQGIASRNFLTFILNKRENSSSKEFLDRIGAIRAVGLVAKTYSSDIEASRELLERILKMIEIPGFDINYFSNLTEEVKYIIPYDPVFVENVYAIVFGHYEQSTEKTSMGGGVLFNLVGNRRQDYELCQFRLQTLFPEFLTRSPNIAIRIGLKIVNEYALRKQGDIRKDTTSNFTYNGNDYTIIKDFSYLWSDSRRYMDKPLELAYNIKDYWTSLIRENKVEETISILHKSLEKIRVAFLWKIFFEFLAENSEALAGEFLKLALHPVLLKTVEISFALKSFLANCIPFIDNDKQKILEEDLFQTFNNEIDKDRLQEFLSILPKESLALESTKIFMSDKSVIPNKPPVEYSSSISEYTTELWLNDQGVNTQADLNKKLLSEINFLEKFNRQYNNNNNEPVQESISEVFSLMQSVYQTLSKEKLNEHLYYSAANETAQAATILVKTKYSFDEGQRLFIKKVIIDSFNSRTTVDDSNANKSPAVGYSPTPRTSAAEGLIPLYFWYTDEKVEMLIKEAVNDISGPIRFNSLIHSGRLFSDHYDLYHQIIYDRFKFETDDFIYGYLLSLVTFKTETIIKDATYVVDQTNKRVFERERNRQLLDSYAQFLLYFSFDSNIELPIVESTLFNAYESPELCNTIVFELFKTISIPNEDADKSILKTVKRKFNIVSHYVKQAGRLLVEKTAEQDSFDDKEVQDAIKLIEQVVMRIYFCLEPRSTNSIRRNRRTSQWNNNFYNYVKPLFLEIIELSGNVTPGGFMLAGTAHYFIQSLNIFLPSDPATILEMTSKVTKYSFRAGYTLDSLSVREIVKFTETLLADHRELLLKDQSFSHLLDILDIYINSGWVDALELLWKLDEVFK